MNTLDTHPDFERLIDITAARIGILPIFIRKDYWVTRILRAIARDETLHRQVIFKGGTSLSKGWHLIDRFSEDIDLLTTGPEFSDPPSKSERERIFKAIRARIEQDTSLRLPDLSNLPPQQKAFLYTRAPYHCNIRYPVPGLATHSQNALTDYVLVEMGFRGGSHPHLSVPLNSFLGETILALDSGQRDALAAYEADFQPFPMELLHPTRTFVEKLLAIHCALVAQGIDHVRSRHYYDLAALLGNEQVQTFLRSNQVTPLVGEAIRISNHFFNSNLDPALNLASSPALNLTPQHIRALTTQYENERGYYFNNPPSFGQILEAISAIRHLLERSTA